jgi:hypothetical protein
MKFRTDLLVSAAILTCLASAAHAGAFTAGNLVISVYGDVNGTSYVDNQASPIELEQITTGGAFVSSMLLPQSNAMVNGVQNYAISGEYGSSSEGLLQRSSNGAYLTIAGYGISAAQFDANAQSFGGGTKTCIGVGTCYPLAQTASVPTAGATVVSRVIGLIDANGNVNTSTALTGVFNENNPRSVATADGKSFYISGQGFDKNDTTTQGVFLAQLGATTATPIDTSFDTRSVEIVNGKLYVSSDSTEGSGVHENISTYGGLPTSAATASILPDLQSKYKTTSASQLNSLDGALGGQKIYLSPESYFFANATTLYIADSGNPKGDNNGTGKTTQGLGDGGLQKWVLSGGVWTLEYTLSAGLLDFVPDTTACGPNQVDCGTTGLIGLTGEVVGDDVDLFATNSTLGDEDQTYLYGITDALDSTTGAGEAFAMLDKAAPGTNIRGVAFAPVPEPATWMVFLLGLLGLGALVRFGSGPGRRTV